MKFGLAILLSVNAILLLPALIAGADFLRILPEPPSWPQDVIIQNRTPHAIKVTPVCVGSDGIPVTANLYKDRTTLRLLDQRGVFPVPAGGELALVYDREFGEMATIIVEDESGRLVQMSPPEPKPDETVTIVVSAFSTLEPLSAKYVATFVEAQRPLPRFRWSLVWFVVPCITFALLLVSNYRLRKRRSLSSSDLLFSE